MQCCNGDSGDWNASDGGGRTRVFDTEIPTIFSQNTETPTHFFANTVTDKLFSELVLHYCQGFYRFMFADFKVSKVLCSFLHFALSFLEEIEIRETNFCKYVFSCM